MQLGPSVEEIEDAGYNYIACFELLKDHLRLARELKPFEGKHVVFEEAWKLLESDVWTLDVMSQETNITIMYSGRMIREALYEVACWE